jgi:FdhD protein
MSDGAVPQNFHIYKDDEWQETEAEVIEEGFITIYVNGQELATLMGTPRDPLQLALGFLANEEFISAYSEVKIEHVCDTGDCIDIWLSHSVWDKPRRKIITTGCTGGMTFADLAAHLEPVKSDRTISPARISSLINQLQSQDSLYARARGVHTSALSDGERLVLVAEDIGRHNTLDRLRGECLRQGLDPAGMILLSTGRISSEMINKAAKMRCPIIASRTSPTSMSVGLASEWNVTLCGYVRRNQMNVYTHPERLMEAKFSLQTPEYWVADFETTPGSD